MVHIGVRNVSTSWNPLELIWHRGFQEVEIPRFRDSRHVNVHLPLWIYSWYSFLAARCGIVVKALHYKPAGRRFDSR
jgi:hypothetical protein